MCTRTRMDWSSWLSKSALDKSLVHDYAQVFSQNQLEESDVPYFDHEFLQSMGISIAKHRLEILKLAARRSKRLRRRPSFIKCYFRRWVSCSNESALAVVTTRMRCEESERPLEIEAETPPPLIADVGMGISSSSTMGSSPTPSSWSLGGRCGYEPEDDFSWGVEEIRWDSMFQDMKPT